jgi:hypothetical protein
MFEPLKYIHMSKIAELQMKALRKLLEDQVIGFDWTENALKEITRVGFDPIYGARPLRRAIQKLVENPISTFIIEQKAVAGDKIIVDFDGENFIFNTQKVEFESSLNYTPINPDTGAKLSKDTSVLPKEPPKTEPTPTAPPSATIDTSFTAKAAIA